MCCLVIIVKAKLPKGVLWSFYWGKGVKMKGYGLNRSGFVFCFAIGVILLLSANPALSLDFCVDTASELQAALSMQQHPSTKKTLSELSKVHITVNFILYINRGFWCHFRRRLYSWLFRESG